MSRPLSLFLSLLLVTAAASATPRQPSTDWSQAMAEFAAQDAAAPSPEDCVLFVGSSSIRLWTTLGTDFPGVPAVNRGFGGSQIVDLLVHFDRVIAPHRPRLIVFYSGTNDIAAGKAPAEVIRDFEEFRRQVFALRPGAKIAFLSLQYAPARWALRDKMAEVNAAVKHLCAADPRLEFVDTNPAMLGADAQPRLELYSADRLHMSPAGYAVWKALVAPVVNR